MSGDHEGHDGLEGPAGHEGHDKHAGHSVAMFWRRQTWASPSERAPTWPSSRPASCSLMTTRDVVAAIELSRASYRKMIDNLVWASGYNLVAIPIAAGLL